MYHSTAQRSTPPHTPHDDDLADLAHQVVALERREAAAGGAAEEVGHERVQLMQRPRPRREAAERAEDAALRAHVARVQLAHDAGVQRGGERAQRAGPALARVADVDRVGGRRELGSDDGQLVCSMRGVWRRCSVTQMSDSWEATMAGGTAAV